MKLIVKNLFNLKRFLKTGGIKKKQKAGTDLLKNSYLFLKVGNNIPVNI
jgi:hypothetical protein